MEGFDFSKASVDDFKLSEPAQEQPAAQEAPSATPAEPATQEPAGPAPVEPAPPAEPKADPEPYKFKDDFIKGVVEFYEKTGDIRPYIEAMSVDFKAMPDEEVLRRDLREQYSGLSDAAFDRLYRQQVVDRFKLDPDQYSPEDIELGKELLKLEADSKREKFIQWQQSFKAPEPAKAEAEEDKTVEAFSKFVQESEATKSLLNDRRIVVKSGDQQFNFEVPNANDLVEMSVDNNKFFNLFVKEDGSVDLNKFYKVAAIAANEELYERSVINWAKSIGAQEVTKDIKNPAPITGSGDIPTETAGDFMDGLLNAFATRGVRK